MTELDDPWDVAASGEPRASQCSSLSNSRSTSNADLTDSGNYIYIIIYILYIYTYI